MSGSTVFASSKSDVTDLTNMVKIYQFVVPPLENGPIVIQRPIIPLQVITPISTGLSNDWLWEDYWMPVGSWAQYNFSCTAPINFVLLEGDENQYEWNNALLNGNVNLAHTVAYTTRNNVVSGSVNYQSTVTSQEIYFALENNYDDTSSCSISLIIFYQTYGDLDTNQTLCTTPCTVDQSNGEYIILVAPSTSNPINEYSGDNEFTVQADQYTVQINQDLKTVATVKNMMIIFGSVFGFMLILCLIIESYRYSTPSPRRSPQQQISSTTVPLSTEPITSASVPLSVQSTTSTNVSVQPNVVSVMAPGKEKSIENTTAIELTAPSTPFGPVAPFAVPPPPYVHENNSVVMHIMPSAPDVPVLMTPAFASAMNQLSTEMKPSSN